MMLWPTILARARTLHPCRAKQEVVGVDPTGSTNIQQGDKRCKQKHKIRKRHRRDEDPRSTQKRHPGKCSVVPEKRHGHQPRSRQDPGGNLPCQTVGLIEMSRSSSGLRTLAFYQVTGVRLSYGTPINVSVAQWAEQRFPKPQVGGSRPSRYASSISVYRCGRGEMVNALDCGSVVMGSSPIGHPYRH